MFPIEQFDCLSKEEIMTLGTLPQVPVQYVILKTDESIFPVIDVITYADSTFYYWDTHEEMYKDWCPSVAREWLRTDIIKTYIPKKEKDFEI